MGLLSHASVVKSYYTVKPLIPRRLLILVRQVVAARKLSRYGDVWPIDRTAGQLPAGWGGWPDGKSFALVLTHDVETAQGQSQCLRLMDVEKELGFRSAFNFVPKEYRVSGELRRCLADNGFEVGVHGLFHNGRMYESEQIFRTHAEQINSYLADWGAVGFRSPCMFHNLEWLHCLNIRYDASTFDTDPFEPQSDGMGTIFPFHVSGGASRDGYVELPYTLPQDFTLFVLLRERNIETWKEKMEWIADRGGMVLINTHPDYMEFGQNGKGYDRYPAGYYAELLGHIKARYAGRYWHVLPRELADFWHDRSGADG